MYTAIQSAIAVDFTLYKIKLLLLLLLLIRAFDIIIIIYYYLLLNFISGTYARNDKGPENT